MMRAGLAAAILLTLSGCLSGGPSDPTPAGTALGLGEDEERVVANNTTLPTLGMAVDPWLPNETERVLFNGTARTTGPCYAPVPLDDGAFLLPGTTALRVTADATDALKGGSFHFDVLSHGRQWNGGSQPEDTAEKTVEWTIELTPRDWDPYGLRRSAAKLSFECKHDGGVHSLDGAIVATVTAVRDPMWRPDPAPPSLLADQNDTWAPDVEQYVGSRSFGFGGVPEGTLYVTVGVRWAWDPEPTIGASRQDVDMVSEHGRWNYGTERTPSHLIDVYYVPDDLPADEAGAATSASHVELYMACNVPEGCAQILPTTARIRVLVQAWSGPVDLDVIRARLGVEPAEP